MAKAVTWSPLAKQKRKEILQYWIEHNKSKIYSLKLNNLFKEAEQLLSEHPYIGKPTTENNVRFKIVRDYLMFYELIDQEIFILTIWNSRQNPNKLILR